MAKLDREIIQGRLRDAVARELDGCLSEGLYRECYISGCEAWTFRYKYAPPAAFADETIYSGEVHAKVKKKYATAVKAKEHVVAFCLRWRSRYDMDIALSL